MIKVFYYIKDKEGFATDGYYESDNNDLMLFQHINEARKQSKASRENFVLVSTSVSPRKISNWKYEGPVLLFPKKKRKLAFGRYVDDPVPVKVDEPHEEPI
jgi:hypothetical protein